MKIVIAPDKFKGSLSSFEVCHAIEKGLKAASSSFQITKLPLADGGDGLSDIISHYTEAAAKNTEVAGPFFEKTKATWLLSTDRRTAFVEMAKASGLSLLQKHQYNPLLTTSYGTGQLIKEAIESGAEEIVIGIGGSATNDGGIGMAAALGYRFLDEGGKELSPTGGNLRFIKHIDQSNRIDFKGARFKVACDVKNVLYGEAGASKVYSPQKGASPEMVEELERGMINYAELVKKYLGIDVSSIEGGGAAGGMGGGCVAFLNAELKRGVDLIFEYSKAAHHITEADWIITGEGRLDEQTLQGKLIAGVASLAKHYAKPVIIICGSLEISPGQVKGLGAVAAFSIVNKPLSLEQAIEDAEALLQNTALSLGSLLIKR